MTKMIESIDSIAGGGKRAIAGLALLAMLTGCSAFQRIGRQWEKDLDHYVAEPAKGIAAIAVGAGKTLVYDPDSDSIIIGVAKGVASGGYHIVNGAVSIGDTAITVTTDMFKRFEFCYGTGYLDGPYWVTDQGKYSIERGETLDETCSWQKSVDPQHNTRPPRVKEKPRTNPYQHRPYSPRTGHRG
ncbi:hypothetical protein HN698_04810 [Candidatus Woesearchaeota archaeon]|nr:hypothetical protein [Candidatus Woesearchaeota archaeon]MBT7931210.1 hypothetical protein [Candidatus Woesearchaeota archaeon]